VLKKRRKSLEDVRKKLDGNPLRRSWDMPSTEIPKASSTSPDEVERLYQAQFSFAVTGIDHWIWVAYAFVDIVEHKGTVKHYGQLTDDYGVPADPLADGRIPIEARFILPPREYFLKVFQIRIRKVKNEWHYIIRRLQKEVTQYVLWSALRG
jgi:hypothetical protein